MRSFWCVVRAHAGGYYGTDSRLVGMTVRAGLGRKRGCLCLHAASNSRRTAGASACKFHERCWRLVSLASGFATLRYTKLPQYVVSRVGHKAVANNESLCIVRSLVQHVGVSSFLDVGTGLSEPARAAQTCCMFLPGQFDVGNVQRIRTLVPLNHMHGSPSTVTLSPISRSPFLSGVVRECLPARGIRGGTALCPRYPIGVISRSA